MPNVRLILSQYRLRQLLTRVAEEYLWWLIRGLPGFEGVVLRYLFLKVTTRRLAGFCWISQGCTIVNSYNLSIGARFATNRNVTIDGLGGIDIGDDTGIGPNCVIFSHEHTMLNEQGHFGAEAHRRRKITIGSNVWIGSNCFIKAGVTIGDGAVVGACSNVSSDVPANGRVIGVPARPFVQAMRDMLSRR
jgi:acetyltransferase-like isoleucine patch superfamily enzyme